MRAASEPRSERSPNVRLNRLSARMSTCCEEARAPVVVAMSRPRQTPGTARRSLALFPAPWAGTTARSGPLLAGRSPRESGGRRGDADAKTQVFFARFTSLVFFFVRYTPHQVLCWSFLDHLQGSVLASSSRGKDRRMELTVLFACSRMPLSHFGQASQRFAAMIQRRKDETLTEHSRKLILYVRGE